METTIFEVKLTNGRVFRIFCANSTQKKRFRKSYSEIDDKGKTYRVLSNGIHNISEWENIVKTVI